MHCRYRLVDILELLLKFFDRKEGDTIFSKRASHLYRYMIIMQQHLDWFLQVADQYRLKLEARVRTRVKMRIGLRANEASDAPLHCGRAELFLLPCILHAANVSVIW